MKCKLTQPFQTQEITGKKKDTLTWTKKKKLEKDKTNHIPKEREREGEEKSKERRGKRASRKGKTREIREKQQDSGT